MTAFNQGTVLKYIWNEGAFKGGEYRVDLLEDGKLRWEGLAGAEKGESAVEDSYYTTRLADDVYLLSWLEGIGYTVSLVIDVKANEVTGIASNNTEHYPLKGSLLELSSGT